MTSLLAALQLQQCFAMHFQHCILCLSEKLVVVITSLKDFYVVFSLLTMDLKEYISCTELKSKGLRS